MSDFRRSFRTKSTIEELKDRSLKKQNRSIFEKDDDREITKKFNDQKYAKKKEFAHADFIERLIIEASSNKQQQRRRPSVTSSNNSYGIDRLLEDENNDWFFEKILEKFDNIRSKKVNRYPRHSSNDFYNDQNVAHGVERIVERRYYVKKPRLAPKRDQLTSTSDLRGYEQKNRQYSGVSSITAATTICSQCSASTPTYIENLRDQSDTLRNEINDLKNEIEHLQTSQQEFFQQLKTHFPAKTDSTTTSQNLGQPMIVPLQSSTEKAERSGILPVPLTAGQKARSTSTESQASSSSSTSPSSSEQTTTTTEIIAKPNAVPASKPVAPMPFIAEFIATKNPTIAPNDPYISSKPSSIAPTPPVNKQVNSKPSPIVPTPPVNEQVNSKPPSIVPTPPVNGQIGSKPSSIASTPPVDEQINSKPPLVAPTPPVNGQVNAALQNTGYVSSKPSSIAPTPPLTEFTTFKNPVIVPAPPVAPSSVPTARIPIYENELAHRRVLSPRSQIVASSASIQDSSDSSSGSVTPELILPNPQKILKAPVTTLRTNELNDLVRYSSQLELSGFPPSITPVISNPNRNSSFWNSVDQYIENARSTNINIGLPPIPRANNGNRFVLKNNNTNKRLDKYNLEIRPQEFIESSAPLLMPPFDFLS